MKTITDIKRAGDSQSKARQEILLRIKNNLVASRVKHDALAVHQSSLSPNIEALSVSSTSAARADHYLAGEQAPPSAATIDARQLFDCFKTNLETVGGQAFWCENETAAAAKLRSIIGGLQKANSGLQLRIAVSNDAIAQQVAAQASIEVEVDGDKNSLFECEVGITGAQAAIAETGTLVLSGKHENHRLASLIPPIHIAVITPHSLCLTLGDALACVSPHAMPASLTFITGVSRTADIELTLALGVHGPQQLYVLLCDIAGCESRIFFLHEKI